MQARPWALSECALFGAALIAWALGASATDVAPRAGNVDARRLHDAAGEPGEWLAIGRDANGSFYSPLATINRDSVKQLGFAWEFKLGTHRGLQATPLVIDGVMYAVGDWGIVYALDAASGAQRWRFDPNSNPQVARFEQNDVVNRGIAVWEGRVYVVSPDCRLIALDAASGRMLWRVQTLEEPKQPYACAGFPQLAGDVIVIGNTGGDTSPGGLRGYVTAIDLKSGTFRWRFHTVPSLRDLNPTPEMAAAAKSWDPKRDPNFGGGGAVWDGMAYDPPLNLVYLGTGNAAPWGGLPGGAGRGGDNLYAASIVAVNAETGRMAWYFQTTPGDRWDFDAAAPIVLADLDVAGRKRATLLQANKNGYFYVLDRATGEPISAKPFAYMNWSSGLDAHYRPILTAQADYHSTPKLIYPSVSGAHSWPPMAFSPRTGLAYIPSIDAPNFLIDLNQRAAAKIKSIDEATSGITFVFPDKSFDPAAWTPFYGPIPRAPKANPKTGKALVRSSIKAWDPIAGRIVWEQQTSDGYVVIDGGTLVTGGDLVFAGREDGQFVAYDARTGAVLKALDTGTPIMAAPMTYEVGGTQYIAVMAAHGGGYLGSFINTAAMKYVNEARILVFKLGGSAVPRPPLRTESPYREPPPQKAGAATIAEGARLYNIWCARCHSLGVPGVTPDLSRLNDGIENLAVFQAIVLKGAYLSRGMARFDDVLSPADTEALHAFFIDQAWDNYRQQQKKAQPSP
jgi:quinohemoprotein ethanol dehydrogenase